jgi:hypothetical protein
MIDSCGGFNQVLMVSHLKFSISTEQVFVYWVFHTDIYIVPLYRKILYGVTQNVYHQTTKTTSPGFGGPTHMHPVCLRRIMLVRQAMR